MNPRNFDYITPASLEEALKILSDNEDAKILAGGQSLVPLMKLRLIAPTVVVDITRLPELARIEQRNGRIEIGALTTHDQIENSPLVRKKLLLLAEAAARIADQQIRNRGTIGGSLCHADPAADIPVVAVALDADIISTSKSGTKSHIATEFFQGPFSSMIEKDEILTQVRFDALDENTVGAYLKHSLREGDFAMVNAAVRLRINDKGEMERVNIAVGAVGDRPIRLRREEEALRGTKIHDDQKIGEVARISSEDVTPTSDIHASEEYKRKIVGVIVERTIKLALSRYEGLPR